MPGLLTTAQHFVVLEESGRDDTVDTFELHQSHMRVSTKYLQNCTSHTIRFTEPTPKGRPSGIRPHREGAGPLPLVRKGSDLQS